MSRLKDRNRHIPGGFRMRIPELRYQSPPFASFDSITNEVLRLLQSNPKVTTEHNFPTQRFQVENWIDEYNASICERSGWMTYIEGGSASGGDPPPPKWLSLRRKGPLGRGAAGAASLLSWLGDGAEPVEEQLSQQRSEICSKCPFNRQMNLADVFIRTVSEMIRRQVEFAKECGLTTANDEKLGVCGICSCPIKLMVHVPLKYKLKSLDENTLDSLPEHCWVKLEKMSTIVDKGFVSISRSTTENKQ